MSGLAVLDTHPVQYRGPLYRLLAERHGIPVTAIYGSDFSLAGCRDPEFGRPIAWDNDLLSGYASVFLGRAARGGARRLEEVSPRGLSAALRRAAPEAILLLGYGHRFHLAGFAAALAMRRPLLFRGEVTDGERARSRARSTLRDGLLRRFYRRFQRLLYLGVAARRHLLRLGCPPENLVFSPYGVDTSPFRPGERDREALRAAARAALGIGPGERVLLFSGKLTPRKAPGLLLEAVRRLPDLVRSDVTVLYLGDGELREPLTRAARSAPQVRARFAGFKNQSELSRTYHAGDVLVVPSESETWGLVVNEGLHHGLPCVASSTVPSAADLIEPGVTGEVFAVGSADALATALRRSLAGAQGPEARAACRAAAARYSLERAADGVAEAYRQVGAGRAGVERWGRRAASGSSSPSAR